MRASLRASELARSTLAGETARMTLKRQLRRAVHNSRVGLADVVEDEVLDLPLNVRRLVSDGDLGETGKVDEGEVEETRAVDLQVDRELGNTLDVSRRDYVSSPCSDQRRGRSQPQSLS